MPKITQNQIDRVISLYNVGEKIIDISINQNISRPTVRKILRVAGIRDVRAKDLNKTSTLNIEMFNKIDTEEKAYFLGLMFADGNNYIGSKRKHYTISLSLAENDKQLLELFRDKIAPGYRLYPITTPEPQQNQYKIMFDSKIISNQLSLLGCVPKKSLVLEFPIQHLNGDDLIRHFIRGYFDGDGCICSSNRKGLRNPIFSFSIVSTKNFCLKIKEIIEEKLNIHCYMYTRKTNNITSELVIGGNQQVRKLYEWLYKNSNFYMKRKFNKFKDLEAYYV